MKVSTAVGLLVASALGVGAYLMFKEKPSHGAIGIDPSGSVTPNCAGVREAILSAVTASSSFREGSTLSLLEMGSDARSSDPKLRFTLPIPFVPDVIYGQDKEKQEKERAELFERVEGSCRAAKPGSNSPIYQLVKQGLAHLHSDQLRCGEKRSCFYLVKSDLDEGVETALRDTLRRATAEPDTPVPAGMAGSLNNEGVTVQFCGTAEVEPRREGASSGASTETRMRLWKALFARGDLVTFQPYCR